MNNEKSTIKDSLKIKNPAPYKCRIFNAYILKDYFKLLTNFVNLDLLLAALFL
jgi:hypothetical protein